MPRHSKKLPAKTQDAARQVRSGATKRLLVAGGLITTILIASITPSVSSLISDGLGISEPRLVHVGSVPNTPRLEVKDLRDNRHVLHIIMRPVFKNTAFKSGHVEKIKVSTDGLKDSPEAVNLIYLDRSEIGWFQQKEIRCEFLVIINGATITPQPSTLTFKVYFYGSKGNEVYWEGIQIQGWQQAG